MSRANTNEKSGVPQTKKKNPHKLFEPMGSSRTSSVGIVSVKTSDKKEKKLPKKIENVQPVAEILPNDGDRQSRKGEEGGSNTFLIFPVYVVV